MTVYITGLLLFIMQLMIPCQVLLKMNEGQRKRVGGQRREDTKERQRKRVREEDNIKNMSKSIQRPYNPRLTSIWKNVEIKSNIVSCTCMLGCLPKHEAKML